MPNGPATVTAVPTAPATVTPVASASPTVTAVAEDAVLVGAGDISGCTWSEDEATAALLDTLFPTGVGTAAGTVFTTGDNVYPRGTADQFSRCYAPAWGRHLERTRPAPGNHDYDTAGGKPYYDYFGEKAGPSGLGYYSYDLGNWHVISLNSNVDAGADSDQAQWLRNDLSGLNPAGCLLAYWHHPVFSSGDFHGNNPHMAGLVQVLYDAGVDVVLNGHEHIYERFGPQDPSGVADPGRGFRQFTVGTGGAPLTEIVAIKPNSEVRNTDTYGVLKLTLRPANYRWEFIPVPGQTFTDQGESDCNAAPATRPAGR
ncbi:MAG TPA: metallophosphoesterase [Dehalococcoidia bacterium]|nr:metallophosphoesterase [Dehalococcoidia bacterium]